MEFVDVTSYLYSLSLLFFLDFYIYRLVCVCVCERQQIRVSDTLFLIAYIALYVAKSDLGTEILAISSFFYKAFAFRCSYITFTNYYLM